MHKRLDVEKVANGYIIKIDAGSVTSRTEVYTNLEQLLFEVAKYFGDFKVGQLKEVKIETK